MEGPTQAAVTPAGVRDGSPAALTGLVARRGTAVLAFCEAVCDPADAPLAAAEAFARFRGAVAAADDPGGLHPEVLLLGATRHAAAALARHAVPTSGVRSRLGRGRDRVPLCPQVPALLAARADDMLGPTDLDMLAQHLDRDPACREIEAAFRRAERAYRSPPDRRLPGEVEHAILVALVGAAPMADADVEALLGPQAPALPDVTEPWDDDEEWEFADDNVVAPPADEASPAIVAEAEPAAEPEPVTEPEPLLAPEPVAEPEPEPEPAAVAAPPPVHDAVTGEWPLPARSGLPRTRRTLHLPHPDLAAHGPVYGLVLPAAAIVVAIIIILAVAGVFGGDAPAPNVVTPASLYVG